MSNKITFGLKNVHVAFKGTAQTETIEVTAACTTDGEITITVTATNLLGADSPKAVVVPLSTESHGTVTKVAGAIVNVLNNNTTINAVFVASHVAGIITLQARTVAANDASLAITATVGLTGVTVGSSTNGIAGATSWGVPIAIPGAVGFKPTAQGQETKFRADNILYYFSPTNDGYTSELEMALIPDAVLAEMLGWEIDSNGMLVEISDGTPNKFALMGQVEGDAKNRRFVYYDCQADRPTKENKTKGESVEPATDVLKLTIMPIEIGGKNVVKGVMELSDTNTTAYNAFFGAVTIPSFS